MSIAFDVLRGIGKRHCIPSPEGLKKIKRISLETFLKLKELLGKFNQYVKVKPKCQVNEAPVFNEKRNIAIPSYNRAYEPTPMINTRNSLFWQWRRVISWERYINDPFEKIKRGTM